MPLSRLATIGLGCRGSISAEPPVHPNQNMDQQNRVDSQEGFAFFDDGRGMRSHVEGTVPRGSLQADSHLHRGRTADGAFAKALPPKDTDGNDLKLTQDLLERGKERYAIYCTPCHDGAGTGDGIVVQRGFMKPPSFHEDRVRNIPLGGLYDIVKNGVRNMPGYGQQLNNRDRWAVAAYVRVLQISRRSGLDLIPADKAASMGWEVR